MIVEHYDKEVPRDSVPVDAQSYASAILNILADFTDDKEKLTENQRAILNILDDSAEERVQLARTQRAILNILDDFEIEKKKVEQVNVAFRKETAERERAEKALRHANAQAEAATREIEASKLNEKMKDEFISTVNHELRTPLTSIAGSLGLLAAGTAGALPDNAKRLLKIAHTNCERLVRLTNDILNLQRMNEGTMEAHSEPVEVGSLVEEAIEASQGFIEEFGVSVRLEKGGEQGIVRADPEQLIQVVTNLLSNAVKFSPRGDEVIVAVEADETEVRISIRDHGPEIPESSRGRIFERFFQVDASDSRQKGGTGLGLAIVKQIVDRLGGRVDFESAPGGGTIFKVTLPQAAQSCPAQAVADAADPFADIAEPTSLAQS